MKNLLIFYLFLIFILSATAINIGYAIGPPLLPGVYIQDGSGDLDVGFFSTPLVYDWNSDGKKDLLVGQRYNDGTTDHGYVSFFNNQGTDGTPYFNGSSRHEAGCCLLDVATGF